MADSASQSVHTGKPVLYARKDDAHPEEPDIEACIWLTCDSADNHDEFCGWDFHLGRTVSRDALFDAIQDFHKHHLATRSSQ